MKQQGTAFTAESAAEAMKDFRLPIHIPDTAFVFTVSTGQSISKFAISKLINFNNRLMTLPLLFFFLFSFFFQNCATIHLV